MYIRRRPKPHRCTSAGAQTPGLHPIAETHRKSTHCTSHPSPPRWSVPLHPTPFSRILTEGSGEAMICCLSKTLPRIDIWTFPAFQVSRRLLTGNLALIPLSAGFTFKPLQRDANRGCEQRQVPTHDLPDTDRVDLIIGVPECIPERLDGPPRRPRCKPLGVRTQFCRCFANALKASLHGVSGPAVSLKLRAIHPLQVALDQTNIVQDIPEADSRAARRHARLPWR